MKRNRLLKMFGKGNRLYSIFKMKCPRCHEGDVFVNNNPYNLKTFAKMHERCSACGLKYEIETGFFYGAMYVSYALGVAIFIAIWLASLVFAPDLSIGWMIGILCGALLVLAPLNFYLARMIWLNFFIKYRPPGERLNEQQH